MKRTLLLITAMFLMSVGAYAQQTIFVPSCSGTNDTAAFTSIQSGASASKIRTIKIPYKDDTTKRCHIVGNFTFSANVIIDNVDGSGVLFDNGATISVLSRIVNPVGKQWVFGAPTISFAGNAYTGNSGDLRTSNGAGVDSWTPILPVDYVLSTSYASLAAAVTAIGSTPTDLVVTNSFASGSSPTVPSTLRLIFRSGGSVVLSGTTTILSGSSGWPVQQIFSGSGTLSLSGNNVISWMLPEWFGAKADNSTDCTSAIQKILDIQSAADHDALIQFQRGVYVIAGALQDTSLSNAQIVLPKRSLTTSSIITVEFRGSGAPAHPLQGNTGTVLRSTLSSGNGNVIGVKNDQGHNSSTDAVAVAFSISTYISVTLRDITFRLPSNPTNSAIDLSNVYDPTIDHIRVDTMDLATGGPTQYVIVGGEPMLGLWTVEPTTATSYGIKLPHDYHTAHVQVSNVTILGYYNSLRFAENLEASHITIGASKVGLAAEGGSYPAHIVDATVVATVANLKAVGPAAEYAGKTNVHNGLTLYIDKFKVEDFGTQLPWSTNVWDIDDATNLLKGRVDIWGGHFSDFLWPNPSPINGAKNLDIGNVDLANGKRVEPWVDITSQCTIQAGTGTFTSISVTVLRRIVDGTEVDIQVNGTITTNGTAAGYLGIVLPFNVYQSQVLNGSTLVVGPYQLNAVISAASPGTIVVVKPDGTYFGGNGVVFAVSGRIKISQL